MLIDRVCGLSELELQLKNENPNLKIENEMYDYKKFFNKKKRFNIYNYDNYGKEYLNNETESYMEGI